MVSGGLHHSAGAIGVLQQVLSSLPPDYQLPVVVGAASQRPLPRSAARPARPPLRGAGSVGVRRRADSAGCRLRRPPGLAPPGESRPYLRAYERPADQMVALLGQSAVHQCGHGAWPGDWSRVVRERDRRNRRRAGSQGDGGARCWCRTSPLRNTSTCPSRRSAAARSIGYCRRSGSARCWSSWEQAGRHPSRKRPEPAGVVSQPCDVRLGPEVRSARTRGARSGSRPRRSLPAAARRRWAGCTPGPPRPWPPRSGRARPRCSPAPAPVFSG